MTAARRTSPVVAILMCLATPACAQVDLSSNTAGTLSVMADASPAHRRDALFIYGEGYAFGVTEPSSWLGDTATDAAQYQVNVVFYPSNERSKLVDVTIRVRINTKVVENIAAGLIANMDLYHKKFPTVRFWDLVIQHPSYSDYSKLFFLPKRFYEYVSYLNPGREFWYSFSVTMSIAGRPATDLELAAFENVAESLKAIRTKK